MFLAEYSVADISIIVGIVVGAISTVLGSVGTLVVAIKTAHKVDAVGTAATQAVADNTKAVADVHSLVNANLTAATVRNEQLTATLTEAGVAVPEPPEVTK